MNTKAGARPRNVVIAVIILGIRLLFGLAAIIDAIASGTLDKPIPQSPLDPQTMNLLMMVFAVLSSVTFAFFIYKIYEGRNWARIVYLVFILLSDLTAIPWYVKLFHAPNTLPYPVAVGYTMLLEELATLVAISLLFFGPGASWFNQASTQARQDR